MMCPLGSECPNLNIGRWPESNVKGTVPLGAKCIYVHNINEI